MYTLTCSTGPLPFTNAGETETGTVLYMLTCSTGPLQFTNGGETETVTVLPGETAQFQFSVLSYTDTITSCSLTRPVAATSQNQDNTVNCNSNRRSAWRITIAFSFSLAELINTITDGDDDNYDQ